MESSLLFQRPLLPVVPCGSLHLPSSTNNTIIRYSLSAPSSSSLHLFPENATTSLNTFSPYIITPFFASQTAARLLNGNLNASIQPLTFPRAHRSADSRESVQLPEHSLSPAPQRAPHTLVDHAFSSCDSADQHRESHAPEYQAPFLNPPPLHLRAPLRYGPFTHLHRPFANLRAGRA